MAAIEKFDEEVFQDGDGSAAGASVGRIIAVAKEAAGRGASMQVVNLPKEPDHVYGLFNPADGSYLRVEAVDKPVPPIRSVANDLPSFLSLVKVYGTQTTRPESGDWSDDERSAVYVGENQVVARLFPRTDPANWYDSVSCTLVQTAIFQTVAGLEKNITFRKQRDFREYLRTTLAGTGDDIKRLIQHFARLNWNNQSSGTGAAGAGHMSLSAEAQKHLKTAAGDELPEEIELSLYVFEEFTGEPWLQKIRCAVLINLEEQMTALKPLPGEVSKALRNARQMVATNCMKELGDAAHVFIGNPG